MNERIKQLAEQANADAGSLFAEMLCGDSDVNVKIAESWNSQPQEIRLRIFETILQNQQKFAKLIIEDCIIQCEREWIRHGTDSIHNKAIRGCINSIKKHFGVEE